MRTRVRFAQWVASLLVVVSVAACAPRVAPPPPPAAPPRSATSASASAIRAGTSGDYPPLSIWSAGGRPDGLAPSLLLAFASAERSEVTWSRFRWPELVADVRSRRFDLAADGITVRPDRSIAGRFSVPIATGGAILLLRRPAWAPSDADVRELDRPGLRIVVNRGGHLERVTRKLFYQASVNAISDNTAVRDAFARGDADAAMTNTFEATRWAAGLEGVERIGPLTRDVTALWLSADRADLAERLDAWLLDEEEKGRLAALRTRWLGGGEATAKPVSALLAATAERLALMPYVAAAKRRIGKAVEDTAQEERVISAAVEAVAKAAAARGRQPPPAARTRAFFAAQIDGAKEVQAKKALEDEAAASFTLDDDLRPAIARISQRMAFLLVRVPPALRADEVQAQARTALAESGLEAPAIARLASAIVALSE